MGLAAVVALFFRHVLRPLLRRIPDRQLALYVEEHNDHFEGALMTAAEFGPRADGAAPAQGKMVRAVIEAAARRAEREDPRRAVVLARLRKYGRWAIAVVAAYAAAFLLLREQVSASARHVLMPLNVTTEETQRQQEGPAGVKPIELRLSSLSPPMRPMAAFGCRAAAASPWRSFCRGPRSSRSFSITASPPRPPRRRPPGSGWKCKASIRSTRWPCC